MKKVHNNIISYFFEKKETNIIRLWWKNHHLIQGSKKWILVKKCIWF